MKYTLPLLLLCSSTVLGYVFDCLDKCECDTKDEVIHCHSGERTTLLLPEGERLRGYHAIGMTYNKIEQLPPESDILARFPDLLAIDVERNAEFDCSSIVNYAKIKIISDCYKNISDIDQIPELQRPTPECDFSCQAKKHYDDLHKYVLKLWEIIKEKYENFDKDRAIQQLKAFFIETIQSLNRHVDRTLEEFHPRNQKKPTEEPPVPVTETVTDTPLAPLPTHEEDAINLD